MIKIEVSDNSNEASIYHYHRNTITIGKSLKCNVIINDIKSNPIDLIINVNKKGPYGTGIKMSSCLYNGKKLSGKKLFKKEDTITIGNTSITIKDFSFESNSFDQETLPELNKKALLENPDLKTIFNALSKELIELSRDLRVQK